MIRETDLFIIKYLVEILGINPNILADDDWSPLRMALNDEGNLQIVKYFIEDLKCNPFELMNG